jgi:hypothetical protein
MPINNSKLNKSAPEPIVSYPPPTEPTIPALLAATRDRHDRELAALQTQVDGLAEEFASRAAAIVEAGLNHSYQLARQKIGAIDLGFFDSGDAPETINLLPSAVEV